MPPPTRPRRAKTPSSRTLAVSPEQQAGLWRAKLRGLARDGLGRVEGADHEAPWGAALDTDGAWTVLLEAAPTRSFGQALVLAERHNANALDLLVDEPVAADVARRAALFEPTPTVWAIDGTTLRPAAPMPLLRVAAPAIEARIADLLAQFDDVMVVAEHGRITAECRGLEVARLSGVAADQRIDVGVGVYDQGAYAVMHPDATESESLADVVGQVLDKRRPGALTHPINRLVRERWIRAELLADPRAVGLESLAPVEGVEPRDGLHDVAPAFAVGVDAAGSTVLVACSVGIDLDLVPHAVDVAAREQAERVTLVLPDRDQHRLIAAVAARAVVPCSIVTAVEPWA